MCVNVSLKVSQQLFFFKVDKNLERKKNGGDS